MANIEIPDFKQRPAYTVPQLVTTGLGSRRLFYRAIESGRLRARCLGPRKTIVLHADLMKFLETLPEVS